MLFSKFAFAAATLASTTFAQNSTRKLKWFGINESGAEFGEKNFTGVYGKEFIWYDLNTIDQFMEQGVNHFRLNFCTSTIPHPLPSVSNIQSE
jgi:endoglucanase